MARRRAIVAGGGTGGHLYPAINLAEALERGSGHEVEVLLVGAQRGIESRVLPQLEIAHVLLPLEPIYRSRPWRNWRTVYAALRSSREIVNLFRSFEPGLVVGTGGYASGPVVAAALYGRIRSAIQEQNSYPGLTTRWLAPHVDQVHLGSAEALRYLEKLPRAHVRLHGNPIRTPNRRLDAGAARRELGLAEEGGGGGRVVLVTGGSQGARAINEALLEALAAVERNELPGLPSDVQLLWSTGPAHHEEVVRRLEGAGGGGGGGGGGIIAVPYIDDMEKALAVATLAVSRAGALSLAELCAWGVPSILVPYPHGAADHQRMNAAALASAGAAVVLDEAELVRDASSIWRALIEVLEDRPGLEAMSRAAEARGAPDAADRIAADLLKLMEGA